MKRSSESYALEDSDRKNHKKFRETFDHKCLQGVFTKALPRVSPKNPEGAPGVLQGFPTEVSPRDSRRISLGCSGGTATGPSDIPKPCKAKSKDSLQISLES